MERIDDLMRGGFRLIQDTDLFCFGIDAVLLADFAKARPGEHVMDLCAGSGVISLLMLARCEEASFEAKRFFEATRFFEALELEDRSYELLLRNIELNHVSHCLTGHHLDVKRVPSVFPRGSFQVVTCNPPYQPLGSGRLVSQSPQRLMARHEVSCTFQDIARAASHLLCDHGRFYFIHRPERLASLFQDLAECELEPKRLCLVHPSVGKAPTQVLIEAVLHGAPGLKILPPLYIYESEGVYTKEICEIYGIDR